MGGVEPGIERSRIVRCFIGCRTCYPSRNAPLQNEIWMSITVIKCGVSFTDYGLRVECGIMYRTCCKVPSTTKAGGRDTQEYPLLTLARAAVLR